VFFVMPAFGSPLAVGRAALELLVLIALAGGIAILLRRYDIVKGSARSFTVMDGTAALLLGLVVIGLMSAVGPALVGNTAAFLIALVAVFAINMPIQLAAASLTARTAPASAPAMGIVAGNRNIAL